jgi:formylmethanofuran:tetrahydromethanopterin formyltransferase
MIASPTMPFAPTLRAVTASQIPKVNSVLEIVLNGMDGAAIEERCDSASMRHAGKASGALRRATTVGSWGRITSPKKILG